MVNLNQTPVQELWQTFKQMSICPRDNVILSIVTHSRWMRTEIGCQGMAGERSVHQSYVEKWMFGWNAHWNLLSIKHTTFFFPFFS